MAKAGLFLGIGAALLSGAVFAQGSLKEEGAVTPVQSATSKDAAIPPLDRTLPEKLETATFALG